jgi:ribosomal protein L12E/L44/L45/RPP1/RPP2
MRIVWLVAEPIEVLERRIDQLRVAVRAAVLAGDKARAKTLRAELRLAEQSWEDVLAQAEAGAGAAEAAGAGGAPPAGTADEGATDGRPRGTGHAGGPPAPSGAATGATETVPLLPLREQVYEALSLLQVPAAPRLIATVHEAFFATTFPTARVTSLRRDEERSFRTAPFARPYYICAALTADFLSPSRGLLAVSTWPLEKRVIGSLSPRVDFLEAAIRVAEAIERIPAPVPAARRLLWRFAASIPGAAADADHIQPDAVRQAAEAELRVHRDEDTRIRREAASRARRQLSDAEQLFGSRSLRRAGTAGAGSAADEEA